MTRLILLTGAPAPSSLQWDENALSNGPERDPEGRSVNVNSSEESYPFSAQWRQVSVRHLHVRTDDPNINLMLGACPDEAIFFNTAHLAPQIESQQTSTLTSISVSTASTQTAAEELDEFYDQSLALHEDHTASQLFEFLSQATDQSGCQWSGEKSQVELPTYADDGRASILFPILPDQLKNIQDIPSAAYLRSIQPQTMTVNLIVGIMSIPSPRSVTVGRRWGRGRENWIVEMLVGDETKAGFEITMWLSDDFRTNGGTTHRNTLESQIIGLRPRDIVLLRNVALDAYQGKVHGQSLRRNITKVVLLYRRKYDDSDIDGIYSPTAWQESTGTDLVMEKARRVNQWLMDFVGHEVHEHFREASATMRAALPPDTQ